MLATRHGTSPLRWHKLGHEHNKLHCDGRAGRNVVHLDRVKPKGAGPSADYSAKKRVKELQFYGQSLL